MSPSCCIIECSGEDLQKQLDDFKAINESVSRVLGEVEEIRININATKFAIGEWKGSIGGLLKLNAELLVLENKLKAPIVEVNEQLMVGVGLLKQQAVLLRATGAGMVGSLSGGRGIGGRQGRPEATSIFGAGAQSAQLVEDAAGIGETIFDGWASVLTSNMNTAWAEIFGEANSLFEQLVNSMADLLVKDVFASLFNFASAGFTGPIGGLIGVIGGLFSSGSSNDQPIIIEMGGMEIGRVVLEGNKQIQDRRLTL